MLVRLDAFDREQLVGEAAVGGRLRVAALALEREGILLLARDAVQLGHVLSGLAHRLEREHRFHARIRKAPAERRVPGGPVAALEGALGLPQHERRTAHGLDAARDEELAVPGTDGVTGADDG